MSDIVEIFTDGACKGNPGPGGWAYLVRRGDKECHDWGGDRNTTNNRMELLAAIMALRSLSEDSDVRLYSDSEYLVKGMTEWIGKWVGKGLEIVLRKISGKPRPVDATLWSYG